MKLELIHCPTPQILFNTMKDSEAYSITVDIVTNQKLGFRRKLLIEGTLYRSNFKAIDCAEIDSVSMMRKVGMTVMCEEITDLISDDLRGRLEDAVIEKHIM
tara:strand:- start:1981 stop:2286 length:306 start_codon:yes stop_codon:yes gene_type:complete